MPYTLEDIRQTGRAVSVSIRSERTYRSNITAEQFPQRFQALRADIRSLSGFVTVLNGLPEPSASRDPGIGLALLPLAITQLISLDRSPKEQMLVELYARTHNGEVDFKDHRYLEGSHAALTMAFATDALPDGSLYLSRSASLSGRLKRLQNEIESIRSSLNDDSYVRNPAMYKEIISGLKTKIQDLETEMGELFGKLNDVKPEAVPECYNSLGFRACLSQDLINGYAVLSSSLESVIAHALMKKVPENPINISFPVLMEDHSVAAEVFSMQPDMISGISGEKELAPFMDTYLDIRQMLLAMHSRAADVPQADSIRNIIETRVVRPFGTDQLQHDCVKALGNSKTPQLLSSAFRLFTSQYFVEGASPGRSLFYGLDDTANINPLQWVIGQYFFSQQQDENDQFLAAISASSKFGDLYSAALKRIKSEVKSKETGRIVEDIRTSIISAKSSSSFFEVIFPVLALRALEHFIDIRTALRCQIPNIEDVKALPGNIAGADRRVIADLSNSAGRVAKTFNISLSDYISSGPEFEQVMEALNDFKLRFKQQTFFVGGQHNVLNRQGVMLAGSFGAGKTHLAQIIASELGAEFVPFDQGKMTEQFKEIKQKSATKPIVYFIDEADSKMPKRDTTWLESGDRRQTNSLLAEIDELRKKYPNVFIIAATNYPEQIDEGMFRPGRFDIKVFISHPGPELRTSMILQAIADEKLDEPSDEELASLVEMSEGLMPLPIIRSIVKTNRIMKAKAAEAGEEGTVAATFSDFREALIREKDAWAVDLEGRADKEKLILDGIRRRWRGEETIKQPYTTFS